MVYRFQNDFNKSLLPLFKFFIQDTAYKFEYLLTKKDNIAAKYFYRNR